MTGRPTSNDKPAGSPVAPQARYWNSPATAHWVTLQQRLDALFESLSYTAIDQAQPLPGEHAIDVGCGCGATVLDLARRVGASGSVTGVDVSEQMLARAAERVAAERLSQVELKLADAETHVFVPESADLVFSRLGAMFFSDPVTAFTNLRGALKPSGRMVLACPRAATENRYITAAVQAVKPLLPTGSIPAAKPDEPGMFSLADPDRVRRILGAAGFRDVTLLPRDESMNLAGPGGAADAAAFSLQFGPMTRVQQDSGPELQRAILDAVTEAYRQLEGPQGIVLAGAFWIIVAHP